MCDVIIAGAGPAGATCAKVLADKGFSVLITERHKLPRYKSCSGMIIEKTIRLISDYFGSDIPDRVKCAPSDNKGMIFINDEGKEYRFEQKGLNVWRSSFDSWLTDMAIDSGAKLIDNRSIIGCDSFSDRVDVEFDKSYREKAAYFVNCGGAANSIILTDSPSKKDFIVTYQCFFRGTIDLDPHYFYAFLQPEFSQYDAWLNVKDGMLVIGTAVKNNDIGKLNGFYSAFKVHLERSYNLNIFEKVKEEKWIMPRIRPDFSVDYGCERILRAGEAAGFLNPMGEGISSAIESGYAAAKAIAENFDRPNKVISQYIINASQTEKYMKRQWHLLSFMSDRFKNMRSI